MKEEVIQVGRFLLKRRDDLTGRERLKNLRKGRKSSRVKQSFSVCKDPGEDEGRCRAVNTTWAAGKRCSRSRQIFSFFCGVHTKAVKALPNDEARPKLLWKLKEILGEIGYRGDLHKLSGFYCFVFLEKSAYPYIHRSKIAKIGDYTIGDWRHFAMQAEEYAYMLIRCVHCKKEFRQAAGTGVICQCGHAHCIDCRLDHKLHPLHKHRIKVQKILGKINKTFQKGGTDGQEKER